MEITDIKSKLKANENLIKDRYKAEILGIFGSLSRGEQKKDSDVDILVRFQDGATLFDYVGLAEFLEDSFDMPVDLVTENGLRQEIETSVRRDLVRI